jgi:hypothetical protein
MLVLILFLKGFAVVVAGFIAIGLFGYGMVSAVEAEPNSLKWFEKMCIGYAALIIAGAILSLFVSVCIGIGSHI